VDSTSDSQSAIGNRQSALGSSHHASRSARPNPAAPQGGPPVFTDDPLVPGVTTIKAVHITELRTAVNQARSRASLAAANWAESVTSGALIKAAHIVELRSRLDEARSALGLSVAPYTDPSLSAGMTVKAAHIQELRQRVTEAITTNFAIPVDGHANHSFDSATNRITTAGFDYDNAGNQVRALAAGGGSQRFQYDAANRLVNVKTDNNQTIIASYTFGDSNERLILEEAGVRTYYACDGSSEYTESGGSTTPQWSKNYIHLGARLLSTVTPNGLGGQFVQYHHSDRLGTRLVTNAQDTTYFEQQTLPFGIALNESPPAGGATGFTNRRFTSYDRSLNTGLDYALNRHYDSQQGRFTQVDPIEMDSVELDDPQTLNLYAYCGNDPVNSIDPNGLFFKKLFKAIWKVLKSKWFGIAVAVALAVITYGAGAGWWSLTSKVTKIINIGMDLGHGTHLATVTATQATTLGWIAAGLSTAAAIPGITSVQGIMQNIGSYGIGKVIGGLGGAVIGGTPAWNPNAGTGVGGLSSFTCDTGDCNGKLQKVSDFGAGFADVITWGFTRWYRRRRGWSSDEEEERLAKSKSYNVGAWTAVIGETAIPGTKVARGVRAGRELIVKGIRIAPLGNATRHPIGRFPHYHRRGPLGPNGFPRPGQGIGRHRPWQRSGHDRRFRDRF